MNTSTRGTVNHIMIRTLLKPLLDVQKMLCFHSVSIHNLLNSQRICIFNLSGSNVRQAVSAG